jgi:GNAT superfamily N-acetyltransferase
LSGESSVENPQPQLQMKPEFEIRPASLADVPALARTVRLGLETYGAFAPRGWEPPPMTGEQARIAERLRLPDAWCRIAEAAGEPAGHVGILAAREDPADDTPIGERRPIPGHGYLWMLFVREPWWGSGLATRLHGLAIAEAAARGCEEMRLVTPAGQRRSRAFYEREGWSTDGIETFEPMLGLDLVTYTRPL